MIYMNYNKDGCVHRNDAEAESFNLFFERKKWWQGGYGHPPDESGMKNAYKLAKYR